MASLDEVEKMLKIVKARSHPLKTKLLHLLMIYGKLSTSDLVEKTGKSKPTILKHLDELEDLDEVNYYEEISPGAYDRRIYQVTGSSWSVRGQELRERVRSEPELALGYGNYRLSQLLLLKDMVDSMVDYQTRLNFEVEKAVAQGDGDEIVTLLMDHLGQSNRSYKTRSQLLNQYLREETDPDMQAHLRELLGKIDTKNETKAYVSISLTLPLKRIIEQLSLDEWTKDGNLWI